MSEKYDQQVFHRKAAFKNLAIFIGKHMCLGAFLMKMQVFSSATFLKRVFNTGVSL